MLQHAGHFHHAPQLDFAPTSARARRAQRRHQLARLAAQLRLRFDQAPHLLAEPGIGSGARLLQFLDLVVHLVERFAHRGHHIGDRLLAQFQIAAGRLLGLGEGGPGQFQEGLVVARQRVGGERLKGCLRLALPPAQDQPRQRKPRYKTKHRQNVSHVSHYRAPESGAVLRLGHGAVSDRTRPPSVVLARRLPESRSIIVVLAILVGARSMASYVIEVEWWKELGQFSTWLSMLYYSIAPVALATLLAFAALWIAHARALKFAGTRLGEHRSLRAHLHPRPAAALASSSPPPPSTPGPWCASPDRAACRRPPAPGTMRSSTSRSPFICSICRSTRCCAATCWRW